MIDPPAVSPRLRRLGPLSFEAPNLLALGDALRADGWTHARPKDGRESARYWLNAGDALIIAYLSGAVVVGGRRPDLAVATLQRYLVNPPAPVEQLGMFARVAGGVR